MNKPTLTSQQKHFKSLMLVNEYLPVRFIKLTLIANGTHEEDLTGQ